MENDDYNVVVTGPRRTLLQGSPLKPYFAVPFGDMMAAGDYGLLRTTADVLPDLSGPILAALSGKNKPLPPWEIA
jgi:hypothetical protein